MRVSSGLTLTAALAALALTAGCNSLSGSQGGAEGKAVARLQPTAGNTTSGSITFEQQGHHVLVVAKVSGLKPNQEHGFHVHEKGDCSSPDATSAGGHFNPNAAPHGDATSGPHHAGDMPNLKADANGVAEARFELHGVTVVGSGATDLLGRGVIVHANRDDYVSQPVGNAGARLACAVVTPA
ncbi:superoxide dismutase family protein [Caldimonas brevitalea]|uniref:Superoxide dismutase [Cu-Zn] n=1 Tax=Caldimonas brevitalea TaxID=413882 RepID=A0A0G3BJJ1_9BURK|nr:superoxide dismutase family protein [Caldimonas brevitalea]AKJ29547.1 superoxide dismutase [Caldimonas brevitalea]